MRIVQTTDHKNRGKHIDETAAEIELPNGYHFEPVDRMMNDNEITLSNSNYIIFGLIIEA